MYFVPSTSLQVSLPKSVDVTVVEADDVAELVADDVAVVDTVFCRVVTEDVAVVDAVVKSHPVYDPDCQSEMAWFNAAAVTAHFVNGVPPVESFKIPDRVHCNVPKSEPEYGVVSSITLFKITTAALHLALSANRSMLWFCVSASRWQLISVIELSHCSMIWLSSCLWLTQLFGDAPVSTFK